MSCLEPRDTCGRGKGDGTILQDTANNVNEKQYVCIEITAKYGIAPYHENTALAVHDGTDYAAEEKQNRLLIKD